MSRLLFLILFSVSILLASCGSSRATVERRNLMMPKLHEISKNKRFKPVKYKKRNKLFERKRKSSSTVYKH